MILPLLLGAILLIPLACEQRVGGRLLGGGGGCALEDLVGSRQRERRQSGADAHPWSIRSNCVLFRCEESLFILM